MERLMNPIARRIAPILAAALLSLVAFIPAVASAQSPSVHPHFVGPKSYYLALGDSLAFGFQIDLNWSSGYNDDFYAHLHGNDPNLSYTNYGCPGETSVTFINGDCPWPKFLLKNYYPGPQMQAAVNFIHAHPGQVSPVTLDMGANDLLPCFNEDNGQVNQACVQQAMVNLKQNLPTIYSTLATALDGQGDLLIMDYYDPFIGEYPFTGKFAQQLNQLIQTDAAQYGIPVVDIYPQFTASTICSYTWICSIFDDVHCKDLGYSVIAGDFEQLYPYASPRALPARTTPPATRWHLTPQQLQYLRTHFAHSL
jgi:lysophospholipase L1-like esterase